VTHALALKHVTSSLWLYHIPLVGLAGLNYLGWLGHRVRLQTLILHRWLRVLPSYKFALQPPLRKQKNICPCPALLWCALPPLAGKPHPSLLFALAAPRLGYWNFSVYLVALASSKAVFRGRHPACRHVHSLCGEVKPIVNGLKIISTVSRKIYTTCFSPSKSDSNVKTCCSASSSVSCFQTEQAGGRGSLKKKKKKSLTNNFF